MKNEIKEKILSFIEKKRGTPDTKLSDDTNFFNTGIIPSLAVIELLLLLEKSYNIEIEGDELSEENFGNVEVASQFIFNKIEKKTESKR